MNIFKFYFPCIPKCDFLFVFLDSVNNTIIHLSAQAEAWQSFLNFYLAHTQNRIKQISWIAILYVFLSLVSDN